MNSKQINETNHVKTLMGFLQFFVSTNWT